MFCFKLLSMQLNKLPNMHFLYFIHIILAIILQFLFIWSKIYNFHDGTFIWDKGLVIVVVIWWDTYGHKDKTFEVLSFVLLLMLTYTFWPQQPVPLLFFPSKGEVLPEPYGVVLIFGSWNFPICESNRFLICSEIELLWSQAIYMSHSRITLLQQHV